MDADVVLTRGGVYLARLDPVRGGEIGKLRPVAVLTAQPLLDVDPPVLFVCPLSSRSDPAFGALHVPLPARDRLLRASWALVEHCRAVSRGRLRGERIASLAPEELSEILRRLRRLLDA